MTLAQCDGPTACRVARDVYSDPGYSGVGCPVAVGMGRDGKG